MLPILPLAGENPYGCATFVNIHGGLALRGAGRERLPASFHPVFFPRFGGCCREGLVAFMTESLPALCRLYSSQDVPVGLTFDKSAIARQSHVCLCSKWSAPTTEWQARMSAASGWGCAGPTPTGLPVL
jgi:hypothetical protein